MDGNNNSKGCFLCGEEGHRKSDCPSAGNSGPQKCFSCGEEGHRKSDCPSAVNSGPQKCFNCGQEGHRKSECSEPMKPEKCFKCRQEGHRADDCTNEEIPREIYIPQETGEEELFQQGISSGIKFAEWDQIEVDVKGERKVPPFCSFEDANLRSLLMDNVKKSGYKKPTPVQKYALPIVMAGRDLMACAQTGSGKTAAFLLPILHDILESGETSVRGEQPQRPRALIVAPTRELAVQIKEEARKFALSSTARPVVIYGGTSVRYQTEEVVKGCDVLIATPGRLMDFIDRGYISLDNIKFVVLDEADRMLDMGFCPVIRDLMKRVPAKGQRQTLMFSATFPDEIQNLAQEFLKDYLFVAVGIVGGACQDVVQTFHSVSKFEKREKLREILDQSGTDRTLVFVETKRNADFIAAFLCEKNYPATSIHGDRLQSQRETALSDFKRGRMSILVATAVAARGLDIKGVQHVVNYDMPSSVDEYVHRIGRTGRLGNSGKATSFYDNSDQRDQNLAKDLLGILRKSKVEVPDWLSQEGGGCDDFGESVGAANGATNGNGNDEEWG